MHDLRRLLDSENLHGRADPGHLGQDRRRHRGTAQAADRGGLGTARRGGADLGRCGQDRGQVRALRRAPAATGQSLRTTRGRVSGSLPTRSPGELGVGLRRRGGRRSHRRCAAQRPRAPGPGLRRLAGELGGRTADQPRPGQEDQARQALGRAAGHHRRPVRRAAGRDRQRADQSRRRAGAAAAASPGRGRSGPRSGRERGRDPGRIGDEIGAALPADTVVDRWWRLVGVVQGLLLGCVLVGLPGSSRCSFSASAALARGMPKLFSDVWLLPWSAVMIVVGLGAGWLTARVCTRAVSACRRARERAAARGHPRSG